MCVNPPKRVKKYGPEKQNEGQYEKKMKRKKNSMRIDNMYNIDNTFALDITLKRRGKSDIGGLY